MLFGFISKFVAVNALVPKEKPPIFPPVNSTCDPVICPDDPFKFNVPPLDSKFVPILNPPIVPESAVILPVI